MKILENVGNYEAARIHDERAAYKKQPGLHWFVLCLAYAGAGLGIWIGLKLCGL